MGLIMDLERALERYNKIISGKRTKVKIGKVNSGVYAAASDISKRKIEIGIPAYIDFSKVIYLILLQAIDTHEIGHLLYTPSITDFAKRMVRKYGGQAKEILNAFEDIYIEFKLANQYKGLRFLFPFLAIHQFKKTDLKYPDDLVYFLLVFARSLYAVPSLKKQILSFLKHFIEPKTLVPYLKDIVNFIKARDSNDENKMEEILKKYINPKDLTPQKDISREESDRSQKDNLPQNDFMRLEKEMEDTLKEFQQVESEDPVTRDMTFEVCPLDLEETVLQMINHLDFKKFYESFILNLNYPTTVCFQEIEPEWLKLARLFDIRIRNYKSFISKKGKLKMRISKIIQGRPEFLKKQIMLTKGKVYILLDLSGSMNIRDNIQKAVQILGVLYLIFKKRGFMIEIYGFGDVAGKLPQLPLGKTYLVTPSSSSTFLRPLVPILSQRDYIFIITDGHIHDLEYLPKFIKGAIFLLDNASVEEKIRFKYGVYKKIETQKDLEKAMRKVLFLLTLP